MAISVACRCGKTYRVLDSYAGKPYQCPSCHANLIVPGPGQAAAAPAPATAASPAAPPPPRATTQAAPPPPRITHSPAPAAAPRPAAPTPASPRVTHAAPPPPAPPKAAGKRAPVGLIAGASVGLIVIVAGVVVVATQFLPRKGTESPPPQETPAPPPAPVPAQVAQVEPSKEIEPKKETPPPDPDLTTEQIVAKNEASVALIKGKFGSGTGFLVLPGILATNVHVVQGEFARDLEVHFPSATGNDKGPSKAEIVYEDDKRDLAFLSVRSNLTPLKVAETFEFHRGQDVTIIGSPGVGSAKVLENAISRGVLSTKTSFDGQDYYQLGVSINPGNSGGPVFDAKGHVIGVATLRAAKQEALGFCIPVEDLRSAIARVRAQSPEASADIANRHKLQVICRRLSRASGIFAAGMSEYIKGMDEAIKQGKPPEQGLNAVAQVIDPKLKAVDQLFAADLKSEITDLASSSNTPPQVRQHLVDLWSTYSAMKSYIDSPRGNLNSYKAKALELKDDRSRHVEALQLLLGIRDEES